MANHTLAQNLTRLNKAREDIADAIVARGGSASHTDGLESMPTSIQAIPNQYAQADNGKVVSNGALVSQTSTTATTNGTIDTTTNDEVVIDVPNTYTQSDEGKVVDNGALVAQTATSTTTNGTIDTTTNNSIVVNVANSYSAADEGKVVSNGALVAQGSDSVTENGTVDTTLISSLLVNVQGGGGLRQIAKLTTEDEDITSSDLYIVESGLRIYVFGRIISTRSYQPVFTVPISFDYSKIGDALGGAKRNVNSSNTVSTTSMEKTGERQLRFLSNIYGSSSEGVYVVCFTKST